MTRGSSKTSRKTATAVELVNPGTSGVVYDEAGHSLGGGGRAALDGDPDRVAMRQLTAGHLLAQRGDAWLEVRDGQLVDPAADESTDESAADVVPAPRTDEPGTAE